MKFFRIVFPPNWARSISPAAKLRVEQALAAAADRLEPGGWLVLFDGLEPAGDPAPDRYASAFGTARYVGILTDLWRSTSRCASPAARLKAPCVLSCPGVILPATSPSPSFSGRRLWQSERLQSYQYFTEEEYRAAFERQGLKITDLQTLTVNEEKWRNLVDIDTPGVSFPDEHILILARQVVPNL